MEEKQKKQKILILTADSNGNHPVPATKGGAVSTLIESLVDGNNKKQLVDMTVVTYYDPKAYEKSKKYLNINFIWIKIPKFIRFLDSCSFFFAKNLKKVKMISYKSPFSLLWYIHKSKKIVNECDADKVVLENNVMIARILKNSKYNGKLYYHFHNIPRIDGGCRDVFNKVDKFICVSDFVGNKISSKESAIGQIPKKKIVTLYNCIDTNLFRQIDKNDKHILELKSKYGISNNDFVLIFAGRLSKEKGPDLVLKAMKGLPANTKLIIAGALSYEIDEIDDYQKELHELANNLKYRVIFAGHVTQKEMPYLYNLANVAVLPSVWDEPAGLTMIEAMSCGTPIITTHDGGIPEYVGNSIILNKDNQIVENIINKIMYLETKNNSNEKKELIRKYIVERFNKDKYIDNFVELLK